MTIPLLHAALSFPSAARWHGSFKVNRRSAPQVGAFAEKACITVRVAAPNTARRKDYEELCGEMQLRLLFNVQADGCKRDRCWEADESRQGCSEGFVSFGFIGNVYLSLRHAQCRCLHDPAEHIECCHIDLMNKQSPSSKCSGVKGTCAGSIRTSRPTSCQNKRKYHRVNDHDATPDRDVNNGEDALEAGKHEQSDAMSEQPQKMEKKQ